MSRDTGLAMILLTTTRKAVDVAHELKRIEPPPPLQDANAREKRLRAGTATRNVVLAFGVWG